MRLPRAPAPRPDTYAWQWETRLPGAFFVPSLDPHTMLAQGLYAAKQARVRASGRVCIYEGALGVMFTVRPRSTQPPS